MILWTKKCVRCLLPWIDTEHARHEEECPYCGSPIFTIEEMADEPVR